MMPSTHLDDEQVQRLLHNELTPRGAASVRDHLAGCVECRARVDEAEAEDDEVMGLLGRVDHGQPRIEVATVIARPVRPESTWIRWAAAGLLAVGLAGAAYAIPGSPVRGWLRALVRSAPPPQTVIAAPPPAPAAPVTGGIAVVPGPSFEVVFQSAQTAGEIRVTLTDGADLVVQARATGPSFTSNTDRLVIDNSNSAADFDIAVPRAAPRVEIRIGGRRVFLKQGSRITTPAPDSTPFRIPFTPQTP